MWNPHDPDAVGQTFSLAYLRRAEHEAVVATLTRLRAQVAEGRAAQVREGSMDRPIDVYDSVLTLIDTAIAESRP